MLRPASVRDISSMIHFARRFGLKMAARGEGHQPFGQAMFFWKRAAFTRPLLRLPEEELVCHAALVRSPTSDPDALARTLAGNRILYELNRGGTLYPFAAIELTREEWRRHYGAQWHALQRAKRRYDPDAVFASGPNSYFT